MTLVDTPGYGESLHMEESFDVICGYVNKLFERQLPDGLESMPVSDVETPPAFAGRNAECQHLACCGPSGAVRSGQFT